MKKYKDKNWLYQKYWKEECSMSEIGNICGVDKTTVKYWMVKFNIPYRTRSERLIVRHKKYPHPWSCAPVDAFPENVTPDGVVGMLGGVGEWCSDFYGVRYLKKDVIDPKGPTEKDLSDKSLNPFGEKYHVYRGSNKGRSFGDTVGDGGAYGFLVLMELIKFPIF